MTDQEKTPKVSVIVPVYNVEQYVEQCMDSLLGQTYRNLEIIALDDGSTDSSFQILKRYSEKDERIQLYHWDNVGYSETLRRGISYATGEYLAFLDSDDWAEPHFIESLIQALIKENADFSMGDYFIYNENTQKTAVNQKKWIRDALDQTGGKLAAGSEYVVFDDAVLWNKLYKTEFFSSLEIQINENLATAPDVPVVWCAFLSAEKIAVADTAVVHYRIGRRGQHTGAKDDRFFACFELFRIFFAFVEKHRDLQYMEPYFLHLQLSRYLWGYEKVPEQSRQEYFDKICNAFEQRGYTKGAEIAFPPLENKPLHEKIRVGLLKQLHPITLDAVLKHRKKQFDKVVFLRRFLEKCFLFLHYFTAKRS